MRILFITIVVLLHVALFWELCRKEKLVDGQEIMYMTAWNVRAPTFNHIRKPLGKPKTTVPSSITRTNVLAERSMITNKTSLIQPSSFTSEPDVSPATDLTLDTALKPTLSIDVLRRLARDNEMRRVKSPLEQLHNKEFIVRNVESVVADAAKRGARKDCQNAYAGGLIALIPLIYDTLTDNGCKWK